MPGQTVGEQIAWEIHTGGCSHCKQAKPVDIHMAHYVWSALVISSYSSEGMLACRSCGVKKQLGALAFCLALGWWSITGIILTPIWIIRNLFGVLVGPDSSRPSQKLIDFGHQYALDNGIGQRSPESGQRAPDPDKPWRR